jgi:phosphate transport system substrate-binding protein
MKNPYQYWNEIDAKFSKRKIQAMGPPPTSPLHDLFLHLIMVNGCRGIPEFNALKAAVRHSTCRNLRSDGNFISAGRNPNSTIGWLEDHPSGIGIVDYPLYLKYRDGHTASRMHGYPPTPENISIGTYPLSQPIYLYIKRKHVKAIKGLQQFLYESTSERAISMDGYLVDKGFIPLDDIGRNRARDQAIGLGLISMENLRQ